jgi:hypothetical protein
MVQKTKDKVFTAVQFFLFSAMAVFFVVCTVIAVTIAVTQYNGLKPAVVIEEPDTKPVLYVTAVSPYIFLNTKDGVKLTVLDGRLNEAEFKFSDGKEAARFLGDIAHNFEIVDYTGLYQ